MHSPTQSGPKEQAGQLAIASLGLSAVNLFAYGLLISRVAAYVTVRSLVNPESPPVRFVAESIRQPASPNPGRPVPRSCRRKRAGG